MNIELMSTNRSADADMIFFRDAYCTLVNTIKLCDILNGDPNRYYDPELKEVGISIEECVLTAINDVVCKIDLSNLSGFVLRSQYGKGLASNKYLTSLVGIDAKVQLLNAHASCLRVIPLAELKKIGQQLAFHLGDFIYALSHIIFYPLSAKGVLETKEPLDYSLSHQKFFAAIKRTPREFAMFLVNAQHSYISVIPLFENDPEAWKKLTANLPAGIVDILTDYSIYITPLDVRAFKLNLLSIDESYLERLQNRGENDAHISNQAPDEWNAFLKLVPDAHIEHILEFEDKFTPDLIEPFVTAKKISEKDFDVLISKLKGAADATDFFTEK